MKIAETLIAKKRARIEMLPLIDIVFLLLVFFIYAMLSMAVHRSLPVELPYSQSAEIDREEIISITIEADGTIFLDGKSVTAEELTAALLSQKINQSIKAAALFADRHLEYQVLFLVLDAIKKAGLENVSLQADPDK